MAEPIILDGKFVSMKIKENLKEEIKNIGATNTRPPHLAAILVGDNPASRSYVRNKIHSCEQSGITSTLVQLDATCTQHELMDTIDRLNNDSEIDGFIVQLPLPDHIDEHQVTMAITPHKDVDGFHPVNLGKMMLSLPCYLPATPYGILALLEHYNLSTSGKHVVVVGRSAIVGTPMSILLSRRAKYGNATVTLTHSRTQNLNELTLQADIIIAAIGRVGFISPDMVKDGAIIIDVGINKLDDPSRKRGYRLVGDVDYEGLKAKCKAITPVPGGVGPMTVAALLMNTVESWKQHHIKLK